MLTMYRLPVFGMLTATLYVAGCTPAAPPASKTSPLPSTTAKENSKEDHPHPHPHPEKKDGGHGHGAGPHEGTLADWGGGKFHVEFTVDHDKQEATVYVLGSDEKTPAPIKATDGELLLTIKEPSFQVELMARPLEGETEGNSSRFVGKDEKLGVVQEFEGTISGEVEGTPYAGDFKEEPHKD